MRRVPAEWLLAPLFLLPVLLTVGFVLYARGDYRARTVPYREEPRRLLVDWVEGHPAEAREIRPAFLNIIGPGGPLHPAADQRVPFEIDGREGAAWLGESDLETAPWRFTGSFPAGLTAKALAARNTRYEIQLGAPPASVKGGIDAGAAAFRDLHRGPDLDRLRTSPLPASTKLYFLGSWGLEAEWQDVARLLLTVREYTRELDALPERPGVYRIGKIGLITSGGAWPDLLLPVGKEFFPYDVRREVSEVVRLRFETRAVARGAVPAGVPVAGAWTFEFPFGDDWWRAPLFTRWAVAVGAVVLVLLFVPSALFVAIRRRRLADEARVRFINELAHDLRTPLTSLRLYSEMLAGGRVPEEDRGRYVEVMARESTRVSALLGNLLDLSRLERRARNLEPVRIPLDEAAEAVLADFAAVHPSRADDVRVSGPDGVWVRADRTALARILGNLLDNAGKFTEEGTPVRISWSDLGDGRVRVTVADEGPGVPVKDRRRIFQRYARGAASADTASGTGIGLAVVRELAQAMGGSAALAKTEKGAAFELVLPGGRDE